jgi:peptide/nickel transport system permease protein
MGNFLVTRIFYSGISMIGLIVLVFFLARLTGNPTDLYLPIDASNEARQEFSQLHGFNDSAPVQFGRFVHDLTHFDFGESLHHHRPVLQLVAEACPTTFKLAALAMALALLIAIVIGSLAAWRPNSVFDRIATLISLASASLPNFWVALVGVMVFAVGLRWLPTSGMGGFSHWVLPVAVLVIRPSGLILQVVRSAMIGALSSAYVKTARAKGVKSRAIIFVHSLRNAMLPVVTVAADQAAGMVNGAVIVELVFGFSGIGKLMIDSISYRDFAVLQGGVIVTAMAIFCLNIVVDLVYALLDPRIRHN